tara:strand:- start:1461 stop:2594 length:1134 start_codon:yes stop_codon:yes gene_type:complete
MKKTSCLLFYSFILVNISNATDTINTNYLKNNIPHRNLHVHCESGQEIHTEIKPNRRRRRLTPITIETCVNCKSGTYENGDNICKKCPAGKWQANEKSTECNGSTQCSSGKFGIEAATSNMGCTSCPNGKYSNAFGQNICKICQPGMWSTSDSINCQGEICTAGTGGIQGATSSQDAICTNCVAGKYSYNASCISCSFGQWQDNIGSTECKVFNKKTWGTRIVYHTLENGNPDYSREPYLDDYLYTIARQIAFWASIACSILVVIMCTTYNKLYKYATNISNIDSGNLFCFYFVAVIYSITVTCLVKKGFYEKDGSYIAISVISCLMCTFFGLLYISILCESIYRYYKTCGIRNTPTTPNPINTNQVAVSTNISANV